MITFATWNMGKRATAAAELPRLLRRHDIDVIFLQECQCLVEEPADFTMVFTDDLSPDTAVLMRASPCRTLLKAEESPLSRFGSFATTAMLNLENLEFRVASVHALARAAYRRELAGLDPLAVSRDGVSEPWVNDLSLSLLQPWVEGRRFIIGGDFNTSRLFPDGGEAFFDRAESQGWIDVVRLVNGDALATFFSANSSRHQLDYVFTDRTTAGAVIDVAVDTTVPDARISDHAPVIVRLSLD